MQQKDISTYSDRFGPEGHESVPGTDLLWKSFRHSSIKGNREIADQRGHKHAPEDRLHLSDNVILSSPFFCNELFNITLVALLRRRTAACGAF